MDDKRFPLTPKQRLAISRAELLAAMGYQKVSPAPSVAPQVVPASSPHGIPVQPARRPSKRSVLGRWWARHPLHSALDIGRPYLETMARRQPGRLMAYGAGTGALLMVIKPWKLLSLATLLSLAFRTSDLTGLIAGAFSPEDDDEPPFDDQVPLDEQVS